MLGDVTGVYNLNTGSTESASWGCMSGSSVTGRASAHKCHRRASPASLAADSSKESAIKQFALIA